MNNRVTEIFTGSIGSKYFKIQIEFPFKIIPDIRNNLLFCSSRKAGYRNSFFCSLFSLQFPDKIANIQVIHPKVLAPRRETVGFVYHKPDYVPVDSDSCNRA